MLQMLKVPLTREETEELQTNWTEFIAQQQQRLRLP
jgi:phage baseplate assembly protein gpV